MLKMVLLFHLFFCFHLLGLTGAGQEPYELLHLQDSTLNALQAMPHNGEVPLAVSVSDGDLPKVSSNVLLAESWVRTHVLAYFPAAKITTIVVGNSALCNKSQEHRLSLVLPSLKNIFHSLTRWGLEKEVKVSAALSSECLDLNLSAQDVLKPLLEFLQNTNSTHSLMLPPNFLPASDETKHLIASHLDSLLKLGFYNSSKINLIVPIGEENKIKHLGRKLSFIGATFTDPFLKTPHSPNQSPIVGFPTPANVAKNPLPPVAAASSPAMHFSFAPRLPPVTVFPATPPHHLTLPPCNPLTVTAPAQAPDRGAMGKGLWCMAKPNVPTETLQEAMDYACGAGGADCEAIKPRGSCYFPDTIVAHASYAFNSYWQKNKRQGGTCSFGGTAIIINSDPSFLHCRFVLS